MTINPISPLSTHVELGATVLLQVVSPLNTPKIYTSIEKANPVRAARSLIILNATFLL